MAGLIGKQSAGVKLAVLTAFIMTALASAILTPSRAIADECVFPFTPTAFEDMKDRRLFLDTIELAAFNMLFPGDPYFGVPDLEIGPRSARRTEPGRIPPVLLKSIGWIESSITQTAFEAPFGAIGPALISFDCGHGVAQVTTGMTLPTGENGRGSPEQALVATHFAYNIARGAAILANKWNEAPEMKPVAGSDTSGHPQILENWYFAVWSYNGFTGPGANRSNHPMDPIYGAWPRPAYSCGPSSDGKGHNRANYPYQELVFGCATNPPSVDGRLLWQGQVITLPDLNNPTFREPLKLENFAFPYPNMDIPTPMPFHLDPTPPPDPALRDSVIGAPAIAINRSAVKLGLDPTSGSTVELVNVSNDGTGVLAWYATPSVPWLRVLPYTGVAVGQNMKCDTASPCDRVGHLEITVDATRAPPGRSTGKVTLRALGTNQTMVIDVEVTQVTRLGVPGITRN